MQLGPTSIIDTHAEAFSASYARLVVTADDEHWLSAALAAFCGYGTSVIGCDAEIAVEQTLASDQTPDGRPGAAVLAFCFRAEQLAKAVANRTGQGLLTCPTAEVFDGLPEADERLPLGDFLRYFGDGYEQQSQGAWRVPIMESEASFPPTVGTARGVAGGNLILQGKDQPSALAAARRASEAIAPMPGVITPFPGGVCRSGSKVGSQYERLVASTNEAFCPTLQESVETKLEPGVNCVYEIVINGVDEPAVRAAMQAAIHAAAGDGLIATSAGHYHGKLGRVLIPLRELIQP